MPDTIAFTLRNNHITDVNVTVVDLRTWAPTVENAPLNVGASVAFNHGGGIHPVPAACVVWIAAAIASGVLARKRPRTPVLRALLHPARAARRRVP